jgi:hypothetical protein
LCGHSWNDVDALAKSGQDDEQKEAPGDVVKKNVIFECFAFCMFVYTS